jgi:predicted metal-dependent hydrolase
VAGRLQSIMLSGQRVDYRVRFSVGARKSRIRVGPTGVEVILPQGAKQSSAEGFLRRHATWILDQLAFFRRAGRVRMERREGLPTAILFRGRSTRVLIRHDDSSREYGIVEDSREEICVRLPKSGTIEPLRLLEGWLRKRSREAICARVAERSREMRRRPGRIYIMDQRTKWGGCSCRGNLSFNWRLVLAPPPVLDYIVVHELAHLAEPSHSAKFWLIVRSFCPEYHRHRAWLQKHQKALRPLEEDRGPTSLPA